MRKKMFFLFMLLSVGLLQNIKAEEVAFKGSAPPAVVVGTQFQLAYVVNVLNGTDLRLPPEVSENFDILMGPSVATSRSIQIVNGKRTNASTATYTYILSAKKEGTFNIDPATIKIGNSEYKSNAFTIKVLPPDQASQAQAQQGGGAQPQGGGSPAAASGLSEENIFLRVIVSDRSVYEQEGFLVSFKLYTAYDIAGVNNIKFPEFEGFLAQDIELKDVQWQMESYNGRNYNTAVMKQTVLYPQRSGQLKIGSGKVDAVVRVRNQSRGRNFFDDFFDTYQNVTKPLVSSPVTIDVKPLPTGKPASFSGAVGNYTVSSEINRTELKANEAVTIKLTIKGNGNIKLLKTPEVKFPNDFEVYDPKVDNNIRVTEAGASGTKTIEYMAIPRYAGDFEIPAVNFSYFDTKSGTYKTLSTESYKLKVEKGEGGSEAPVVSNFTNRESVKFLGKDIRYIKTKDVHFVSNKEIFFGSFLYVMAYLMITILFVVFFIIYRKQVKENSNIALVRTKKANKTAVKRLKQAEKLLREDKEEAFYEEVLRALWGYLSDKLNMPQSELTKDNVAAELTKYGVDETLSGEFLEIINTCEFARYAPSKTSGAMDKLFSETIDAIGKMESTIKK
ncbi:MAG: BatD family protein [Tannerella sp.]|nr:BatD family protein [Tannerella sp.]